MTELGRARAVIVIWTDASIKSDWVRSEAGRAQVDRKLIPVKLPHLNYKDLPPPFDVLHTENVGEDDKIRAAVVAQLAKPGVEPSAIALLTKGFKYELLTWVGIVGGALTLFTNLGAVLKLADWARLLFGWLGIHLPPDWTLVLSFLSFGLLLAIGQAVKFNRAINDQPSIDKYQGSFRLLSWRTVLYLVLTPILAIVWWVVLEILIPLPFDPSIEVYFGVVRDVPVIIGVIIFARNHRLHAAVAAFSSQLPLLGL
jgi:hypothetical protein